MDEIRKPVGVTDEDVSSGDEKPELKGGRRYSALLSISRHLPRLG